VKVCSVEGCSNSIWSQGLCAYHVPKKPLRSFKAPTDKDNVKVDIEVNPMHTFFKQLWRERRHVSEISGDKLQSPPSSAYFHHILYKEKYTQAAFDEANLIFLTFDEHSQVHSNPYRYPEINRRRELLMEKFGVK